MKEDKEQIIHICCKCSEKMELYSSDEVDTIESVLHFIEYKCPECDEVIWILDN
ncbi:MAG: hypothetical protein H8D22_06385 [Candidatus Cloacimonetes bacterium]|nr:hypothetical protein [Candidatus Cloacimonadota bacterium]